MDYPPLLADGFQEIGVWQLDQYFLKPFEDKDHDRRLRLIKQLRRFLDELFKLGIPLDIWLDGSFTTTKPEPEDVDMVVWVRESDAELLDSKRLQLFDQMLHKKNRERNKILYNVDVHLSQVESAKGREYWHMQFGFDRSKLNTKGIFTLSLRHV